MEFNMTTLKLMVLYPMPSNVEQFERDYAEHLALFHNKMGVPSDKKPYTVTKMHSDPSNPSPYYQMFSMPFESKEALDEVLTSAQMAEVAADAGRISSGGPPVMLVGRDT
jgi:uncharacterized protein (TIGR02118 family)